MAIPEKNMAMPTRNLPAPQAAAIRPPVQKSQRKSPSNASGTERQRCQEKRKGWRERELCCFDVCACARVRVWFALNRPCALQCLPSATLPLVVTNITSKCFEREVERKTETGRQTDGTERHTFTLPPSQPILSLSLCLTSLPLLKHTGGISASLKTTQSSGELCSLSSGSCADFSQQHSTIFFN